MQTAKLLWLKAAILAKKIVRTSHAIARHQISRYPPFLDEFERRYAMSVGCAHGLSFCNGTSAIEAALFAANIGPGDEVIVPSCTFHASIDPILNAGAMPVFADVEEKTFTLNPVDVAKKLTDRTKAVIVVHVWGIPANMGQLRQVLKDKSVTLIEDVSHAHGARWGDRFCGAWGEFGVFSLQGSKSVAAGEGGIVVTNRWSSYVRMSAWGHFDRHARHFASVGMTAFTHTGIGYKRRMAPLGALLADVDLDYLDTLNRIKQRHVDSLDYELSYLTDIDVARPSLQARRGGFYQGYPIRIERPNVSARSVVEALGAAGIQAQPYPFPLHHKLPVYTDLAFRRSLMTQQPVRSPTAPDVYLPVTDSLKDQLLLLSPRYLLNLNPSLIKTLKRVLDG